MKISDILKPECVLADIQAMTKKDILTELSRPIAEHYDVNLDEMVGVLLNREKLGSTGIGEGVAIPHGKISGLKSIVASIGKSREGLKFDALDGKPCHIFFLLAAPSNSVSGHLKALARASMLLKNPSLRENLLKAETPSEIYRVITEYDNKLDE
ncbi:MAG: PTS sugar transporter subunit IIA [Desulfomonilia bacterium]|jgi:PTS system nitrogen regulatory IIA component|nr:PTS sugar transporter subunit IIA [Pseudomonadota bacterium]HON37529.1 PTS sugar transporter subunit IIA [Deltaproteobacteria bacterium]HPD20704.1 PTS sugar transporter subunit IIA [Deltaproteobacteria bacterium]HPX19096.1 PTS sugar transporter subunit IIA [Deltaproteobacteria bacterium]HRS55634.1 PTS sugar transporter subunit IIA [Desulfomonilia bacterium]